MTQLQPGGFHSNWELWINTSSRSTMFCQKTSIDGTQITESPRSQSQLGLKLGRVEVTGAYETFKLVHSVYNIFVSPPSAQRS